MGASADIAIDLEQREAARSAAGWLPAFHPHVSVTLRHDTVELRSDCHDEDELAAIWTTSMANEVLLARTAAFRASAFEALAR